MPKNPFTPTFGVTPPYLAGRDDDIALVEEALTEGIGSPYRALLVRGARGTGKTVLLNRLEDAARSHGWWVLSSTIRPGVAADIAQTQIAQLLHEHDPGSVVRHADGGTFTIMGSGGGATSSTENVIPRPALTFRSACNASQT